MHKLKRIALAGFGIARGMFDYPAAWFGWFRSQDALAAAVGEILMIGFYGADSKSPSARLLARQMSRGQVGGVFFVSQNIGSLKKVKELIKLFCRNECRPLLGIDHEGGIVQRLTTAHGFTYLPGAREIASTMSLPEARALYGQAGFELRNLGFNVNLGPVLDIDVPSTPGIGRHGRAYHICPKVIASYGQAFVEGFTSAGVLCAAKHFPGHGKAVNDSHAAIANISTTWTEQELEPFIRLLASPNPPQLMMTGHLRIDSIAPEGLPVSTSTTLVTGLLRQRLGYKGVIVTDDLDMKAMSRVMSRREALVKSIAAGNDLIMIKNLFNYDPLLPQRAVSWVRTAIAEGQLSEAQVLAAANRVRKLRHQEKQGSVLQN
ncbi:glycoside hydrolase family 3 N-terminal domain-containing protein [Gilvimarinus sp. 1_MG-2023]|uniref:glycoside hydrolase family 3 N-terminal domain-containing protein n=1 Tax=Gilvimarinus sp. 1_MG-2023 TaxID=3062638 RepID=UPI0026E40A75|nr:glycoside hydrolase family 3 N-terminal domain-containing protein [Gilvimarinus sp. 1_MG-2023]MDO6747596.1 glycoside hydrolase family 3 N-terminal domain-containing protein [Gilvimarinus sp. 1_MG-2023]